MYKLVRNVFNFIIYKYCKFNHINLKLRLIFICIKLQNLLKFNSYYFVLGKKRNLRYKAAKAVLGPR